MYFFGNVRVQSAKEGTEALKVLRIWFESVDSLELVVPAAKKDANSIAVVRAAINEDFVGAEAKNGLREVLLFGTRGAKLRVITRQSPL